MAAIKDTLSFEEIQSRFLSLKNNQFNVANQSASERKKKLKRLKKAIETTYRDAIREALLKDLRKHQSETDLTEIYPVTSEIKHAISHLSSWTSKQRVSTPIAFLGSSSHIHYEPKGVCLIISPWNFPFNLTFGPLVSAIAAGNPVILKPSEHTPNSSKIIKKIIEDVFDKDEVIVIEGAVETSEHLLALSFNHIFFTGAPSIGKIVMEAASKNLASVTLELGGKSPTIVDETANIHTAAKRIAWGKFLNSGQICIAPDYVYVHESKKEALINAFKKQLDTFFGEKAKDSTAFTRIVNEGHTGRIQNLINDAKEKGANVIYGGKCDIKEKYIQPTLITNISEDSKIMEEEIFGPVLPIIPYSDIKEVITSINEKEKPLALYIYSSKKSNQEYIINNTRAGGTCVNNNDVHFYNNNLPFGGSNNSGIGKSHGFFGFQEFSNARSIYKQHIPGALELLMPPYNDVKQKIINLTIKWF